MLNLWNTPQRLGTYWHSIKKLLQIFQLAIQYVSHLLHCVTKVLYLIEIWWMLKPLQYSKLTAKFKKPVWDICNITKGSHQKMGILWSSWDMLGQHWCNWCSHVTKRLDLHNFTATYFVVIKHYSSIIRAVKINAFAT